MMTSNCPTVLILASDPSFSREITTHWPHGPAPHSDVPEFVVLDFSVLGFSSDEGLSSGLCGSQYDLVIADASCEEKRRPAHQGPHKNDKNKNKDRRGPLHQLPDQGLRQALATAGKPAIVIHSDHSSARGLYDIHGAVLELRREPGIWPAMTGLIAREILRRRHSESRAREAEQICVAAQAEATLGRYMVEMRTNVNNALTCVLGNAELLVHEPGLPANVLAQADTIRNMALRLHEVFQRFSSLEKELSVAVRESGRKAASAASGN
jgi:hypothetical protein